MDIFDVVETTWPAAATHVAGPWKIRDGQGGGKRVSSVEWITDHFDADDLDQAEDAMRALGQDALFMIRPEHGVWMRPWPREGMRSSTLSISTKRGQQISP